MKETVKLALAYQKRHQKQFFTAALCIAFFIAAMLSMLLFQSCFSEWQRQQRAAIYGSFTFLAANTTLSKVDIEYMQSESLVGMTAATNKIDCPGIEMQRQPYLGFMDAACITLLHARVTEGALPTQPGQAAIEQTTYDILGLTAKVGETVTLPVEAEGQVTNQTFTLTGLISPYRETWQNVRVDLEERIPTVVTVQGDLAGIKGHVLCENTNFMPREGRFDGTLSSNPFYLADNNPNSEQLRIVTGVMTGLFTLLLVVGVLNVVEITWADRSRYAALLRCIGAGRGQVLGIFWMQGLLLTLAALLLGVGLGALLLWVIVSAFRGFGFDFPLVFRGLPIGLVVLLSAGAILLPYWQQLRRFLRGEPLQLAETQTKRKKRTMGKGSYASLWLRAKRPKLRRQNLLTVLLVSCCMVLVAFGPFYADYMGYGSYHSQESEMEEIGMAYWMGLRGGGKVPQALNIEVPRDKGVPLESVEALQKNKNVRVDYAAITFNSAARLLTSNRDTISPTGRLRERYSVLRLLEGDEKEQNLTSFGYPGGSDVLAYPIYGFSGAQAEALGPTKTSGAFDRAAYDSGRQVVAVGDHFKAGDQLTITVPSFPADFRGDEGDHRQPVIQNQTVTVGAVYKLEPAGTVAEKRLTRYASSFLLFSDQVLLQMDPYGNYDDVCISAVNPNMSQAEQAEVQAVLAQATAKSSSVQTWDKQADAQAKQQLIWQLKLPFLFMIGLFLVAVLAALALSTSLKVKSNLKSFALLRTMGLEGRQLRRLLFFSNLVPCLIGMGIGTAAGLGICFFLQTYAGLSGAPFFLQTVLPAVLIGGVLILLFCILVCIAPQKWVMKQGIMDAMQDTGY